jgi:hypothetical protein
MIDETLIKEAVDGHNQFLEAVENNLPEKFEVGKQLEIKLESINEIMNEYIEIANAIIPINISPAELKIAKESTLKCAEAWGYLSNPSNRSYNSV